jgi:hypothetical protein
MMTPRGMAKRGACELFERMVNLHMDRNRMHRRRARKRPAVKLIIVWDDNRGNENFGSSVNNMRAQENARCAQK